MVTAVIGVNDDEPVFVRKIRTGLDCRQNPADLLIDFIHVVHIFGAGYAEAVPVTVPVELVDVRHDQVDIIAFGPFRPLNPVLCGIGSIQELNDRVEVFAVILRGTNVRGVGRDIAVFAPVVEPCRFQFRIFAGDHRRDGRIFVVLGRCGLTVFVTAVFRGGHAGQNGDMVRRTGRGRVEARVRLI